MPRKESSSEKWVVFGQWSLISQCVLLLFSGVACLLGKIERVNRLAGFLLILIGAWMMIAFLRSIHPKKLLSRK